MRAGATRLPESGCETHLPARAPFLENGVGVQQAEVGRGPRGRTGVDLQDLGIEFLTRLRTSRPDRLRQIRSNPFSTSSFAAKVSGRQLKFSRLISLLIHQYRIIRPVQVGDGLSGVKRDFS